MFLNQIINNILLQIENAKKKIILYELLNNKEKIKNFKNFIKKREERIKELLNLNNKEG